MMVLGLELHGQFKITGINVALVLAQSRRQRRKQPVVSTGVGLAHRPRHAHLIFRQWREQVRERGPVDIQRRQ